MSLFRISSNAVIKLLGKTIVSDNNLIYSPFWSGWSSEPSYDFESTQEEDAVWSVNGNNLDVTPRSALLSFTAYDSNVGGSIDARGCSNLIALNCNNQLTSINVTGCVSLNYLGCSNNQLTTLDISGLVNLSELHCENGQLTTLDVTGTSLLRLYANGNRFTEAVVNHILTTIDELGTLNGWIDIQGGTNASPTGVGITAKNNLLSRGWVVLANG